MEKRIKLTNNDLRSLKEYSEDCYESHGSSCEKRFDLEDNNELLRNDNINYDLEIGLLP